MKFIEHIYIDIVLTNCRRLIWLPREQMVRYCRVEHLHDTCHGFIPHVRRKLHAYKLSVTMTSTTTNDDLESISILT